MIVGDPVSPTHVCALQHVQVTRLRPDRFKALIDEDRSFEDVAARFGVSVPMVQRRLTLSSPSPKLLALCWQDGMGLYQLTAPARRSEPLLV